MGTWTPIPERREEAVQGRIVDQVTAKRAGKVQQPQSEKRGGYTAFYVLVQVRDFEKRDCDQPPSQHLHLAITKRHLEVQCSVFSVEETNAMIDII